MLFSSALVFKNVSVRRVAEICKFIGRTPDLLPDEGRNTYRRDGRASNSSLMGTPTKLCELGTEE